MSQLSLWYSQIISRLSKDEGATAVEYGLMVFLIAVVVAVGAAALGVKVNALFNSVATAI